VATILLNHDPAGNTAGVTVTQANSGGASTDDFSRLNVGDVGTGATFTYASDGGDIVYQLSQGSTGLIAAYDTWAGAQTDYSEEFEIELDNTPSVTCGIFQMFSDDAYGAGAVTMNIQLTAGSPAGRLRIRDQIAAVDYTSALGLVVGTRYTCKFRYTAGTSTATLEVYVKGSTTLYTSVSASIPTATQVNSRRWGILTASTGLNYKMKRVKNGHTGAIARIDVAASSPVVNRGANARRTYQAGTSVSMPWTATITGDTIATMLWRGRRNRLARLILRCRVR
jgi:hypothetical protein